MSCWPVCPQPRRTLRALTAREFARKFSFFTFHAKAADGKSPQRLLLEKREVASSRSVNVKRYLLFQE